jgi:hypothetical protein
MHEFRKRPFIINQEGREIVTKKCDGHSEPGTGHWPNKLIREQGKYVKKTYSRIPIPQKIYLFVMKIIKMCSLY